MERKQTVVITGAASGIGRALALEARRLGLTVYATDRDTEALADLAKAGCHTATLDVCAERDGQALLARLQDDGATPDYWINNAGYGAMGPLLDLDDEAVARQFAVNTFAPLRLSRAVAAPMIEAGGGCIVNVGSIAPLFPTPFAGAYSASKAALNSLSDTLSMELAPWGIAVVSLRPGRIRSDFGQRAGDGLPDVANSRYARAHRAIAARAGASQQGATPADKMARQVWRKLLLRRPPPVIYAGRDSWLLPRLRHWLPRRWLERVLRRVFHLHLLTSSDQHRS
ncbi:MAG: SDR family oxidoreductase [Pseudomonadota bacterium]